VKVSSGNQVVGRNKGSLEDMGGAKTSVAGETGQGTGGSNLGKRPEGSGPKLKPNSKRKKNKSWKSKVG